MRMIYRAAAAAAFLAFFDPAFLSAEAAAAPLKGVASWYKSGKRTANGEPFKPMGMTAAHRSLPFGTKVRVTHSKSGRSVVVRINDRGPFIGGRIIDLSLGAAQVIGLTVAGVAKVEVDVLALGAGRVRAPARQVDKPLRRTGVAYNFNRIGRDSTR